MKVTAKTFSLSLFLSLLLTLFVTYSHSIDVYIAANGVDSPVCGTSIAPCASFDYVFADSDEEEKGIDYRFNLTNSVLHVSAGNYLIQDIQVKFDNLTFSANGTVSITLENRGIELDSNNFVVDGFHFTSSVYATVPAYIFSYENMERNNSFLTVKNCVFENITVVGIVSSSIEEETNNGTLIFQNNRISNLKADSLLKVKDWDVIIQGLVVNNVETNDEAFVLNQQDQTLQVYNATFDTVTSKSMFKFEHSQIVPTLSFTSLTINKADHTQDFLTVLSNEQNIDNLILSDISINQSTNVYFIFDTRFIPNAKLNNIHITNSENPTSSLRLDAVFELPNSNLSISNFNYTENYNVFSVVDIRSTDLPSTYDLNNITISHNVFDTNIYYYDTELPRGGIFHLSAVKNGSITNFSAVNNKGIIQIIGITEATKLVITNAYFQDNELTNGLAHDIVIKGIPVHSASGEVIIQNSTFVDPAPAISCHDSNNFKLTMAHNNFRNESHPYTDSINTRANGLCTVSCDTTEAICGNEVKNHFWLWVLLAAVSVLVVLGVGVLVAWRLREKKRQEYETID